MFAWFLFFFCHWPIIPFHGDFIQDFSCRFRVSSNLKKLRISNHDPWYILRVTLFHPAVALDFFGPTTPYVPVHDHRGLSGIPHRRSVVLGTWVLPHHSPIHRDFWPESFQIQPHRRDRAHLEIHRSSEKTCTSKDNLYKTIAALSYRFHHVTLSTLVGWFHDIAVTSDVSSFAVFLQPFDPLNGEAIDLVPSQQEPRDLPSDGTQRPSHFAMHSAKAWIWCAKTQTWNLMFKGKPAMLTWLTKERWFMRSLKAPLHVLRKHVWINAQSSTNAKQVQVNLIMTKQNINAEK